MLSSLKQINISQLIGEAAELKGSGHRFVTVTCRDAGETHELTYHFDKDYQLVNLRINSPKGNVLPSISSVYFAAVIVENEIKDLFGIDFSGLAIDYQGRFILSEGAPKAPLNKTHGIGVDARIRETSQKGGVA
jgi:NADH:ubiquinone oxidoreductase subunit C